MRSTVLEQLSCLRGAPSVVTGGTALPRRPHTDKAQWHSMNTARNATAQNSHRKVTANRRACAPTVCLAGTRRFSVQGSTSGIQQPRITASPYLPVVSAWQNLSGNPAGRVFIKQARNTQAAGSLAGSSCSLRLWQYRLLSPGYGVIAGLPGTGPPQKSRKHIQGAIRPFASGTWVWTACGTWKRT